MAAQLLAAAILCFATMARSSGAHASATRHRIDADGTHAARRATSRAAGRAVGDISGARDLKDPATRIQRVRSESEAYLAEGRHENALRVIDDEQSLGTVGSESLEELRNRILDDQRFRMLLTKSEAALARHELRRAINLMRQAADMQPGVGSEVEHRRISVRLVQTEAELRYRHGQIAESRGDIKGARVHYAAAIKTTGHVAATKSLARLDQAVERRVLIDRGYRASDQGDHLQAIEHLRQAIAMGAGVEVSPLLADAKLAMMLTEARRLTEANDLDAAIDAYTRALRMRPEKPEIGETLVAMRQRQAYTRHLERGDAIAADGQHLAAKMHYRRARSVTASDEIKQRLENAEFNSLITEVRRRLASKDVLGARAMLRTAARTPGGLRQAQTVEELEDRIGADEAP